MQNQVGVVKDNAATRLADQIKEMNFSRGAAAGRSVGSSMASLPRVRSAPMQAIPLSADEVAEADRRAVELGILSEDEVDPAHLIPPDERPTIPFNPPANEHIPLDYPRMSAREFIGTQSRMLDFNKVEGVDLVNGRALVDGFSLEMAEEDVKKIRKYVLQLAVDYMTQKLAEAMVNLGTLNEEPVIEKATKRKGKKAKEVQLVPQGDSPPATE